jgi:hypothetical protein
MNIQFLLKEINKLLISNDSLFDINCLLIILWGWQSDELLLMLGNYNTTYIVIMANAIEAIKYYQTGVILSSLSW